MLAIEIYIAAGQGSFGDLNKTAAATRSAPARRGKARQGKAGFGTGLCVCVSVFLLLPPLTTRVSAGADLALKSISDI